jgi:AcrR family transcriptional regulator
MAKKHSPPKQVRGQAVFDKILEAADDLFYQEGARVSGVDTIVERSGVAKTSLYRWFPTKDDLVLAYLQRRDELFWRQWESAASAHEGNPRKQIDAEIRWIGRYVASPTFRGCPFINSATEFADPGHPVRHACEAHKRELRARLYAMTKALRARDPKLLADQLAVLIDGAFATAQVSPDLGASRSLELASRTLLDAAL